ncbi:haloacid dehalogenase-like hydrolase [Paenibacillus zeisoli]|uniref:Haloacid dehalogenase-like hydrolase n=1 Tax=Paenibacillus zeisoli TaxID=2496267 RepID=A0A433X716_9BACL|nr:haloacid dehalogenase-like hydrolase [Paenibacillus zeisoli]RUT29931.1 haloacid dehalogenase-like hydrolase [Paenibacillus zeisoli]
MKRILDCRASDFVQMNREELKQSILAAEGRTIISENVVTKSLLPEVSNAELSKAFGADMILLNLFDVFNPGVHGVIAESTFHPNTGSEAGSDRGVIRRLKELTGLPVGVNLEPVDEGADKLETLDTLPEGRRATAASLAEAKTLGFDFICLTGNPKTGVTNEQILQAIQLAKEHFGGLILAGKMHGAGTKGKVTDIDASVRFAEAGADIVLLPAPGTVPGLRERELAAIITAVKDKGALALAAIGTSQEGSDESTIREIALSAKRAGADVFHIGDAGFGGIAVPENIQALSIAIRGRRHTYIRMAASPLR